MYIYEYFLAKYATHHIYMMGRCLVYELVDHVPEPLGGEVDLLRLVVVREQPVEQLQLL